MPLEVAQAIDDLDYRERLHLSHDELMNEPAEVVRRNRLIWALRDERDKLDSERQQLNSAV